MNPDFRDRFLLPVAIPLGFFTLLAVLVFSFSRILLAVEREVAIAIALAAAVDVLVIATLVAGRKPDRPPYHVPLLAVSAVAVIAGGMFSMGAGEPASEEATEPVATGPPGVEITAENIKFDKTELRLPASGEVTIRFVNDDQGIPHNVAIYRDPGMTDAVFRGEVFPGSATRTYRFAAPPPGTYYFKCDVHPAMAGQAVVSEGAGGEDEGEERTGGEARTEAVSIRAKNIAFDKAEIRLAAGREAVIKFDNGDSGIQHNVSVARDERFTDVIFTGAVFRGSATRTYRFPAPSPGTYFFRCDVHPSMKGTVVVA